MPAVATATRPPDGPHHEHQGTTKAPQCATAPTREGQQQLPPQAAYLRHHRPESPSQTSGATTNSAPGFRAASPPFFFVTQAHIRYGTAAAQGHQACRRAYRRDTLVSTPLPLWVGGRDREKTTDDTIRSYSLGPAEEEALIFVTQAHIRYGTAAAQGRQACRRAHRRDTSVSTPLRAYRGPFKDPEAFMALMAN